MTGGDLVAVSDERLLTAAVIAECSRLGLLVHHCADARRCEGDRGLPDLIIVSHGGVLFAELKSDDGDTSADQDRWLYALHTAGVGYVVWRLVDWRAGTIQAHLKDMV